MREFNCPYCRTQLSFEQIECIECRRPAIFDPHQMNMIRLEDTGSCSNRPIIGCNWSSVTDPSYCEACSLTRVVPNIADLRNVGLWKRVEEAKRRLLYDLRRLRLPLSSSQGMKVRFEILSDEHGPVLTGHRAGLITLNLTEADDVERESRRVSMRETYRTLLGHFRHEIGHFYWHVLIDEPRLHAPFRLIFGDERSDYDNALSAYYARPDRSYDPASHISLYATSHPWEDWAETFAHFLHIVATLDSLAGLPLSLETRARETLRDPYLESDFDALLHLWSPLARSINNLNRSLGLAEAYPFNISPAVKGKLHLVHMALVAFRAFNAKKPQA